MRVAALVGLLVVLSGCTPAGQRSQAGAAATAFAQAIADKDGPAACALLIDAARDSLESDSGQSCDKAILEVTAPQGAVRAAVWRDRARVRIGQDTVFLDKTSAGWRVRAAGCQAAGEHRPYDCEVAP